MVAPEPGAIGLPIRPFLYTLDQVAQMLGLSDDRFRAGYVYYEGRSVGLSSKDQFKARNIAPRHERPEWRIPEQELVRWLRHKGFKLYEVGNVIE